MREEPLGCGRLQVAPILDLEWEITMKLHSYRSVLFAVIATTVLLLVADVHPTLAATPPSAAAQAAGAGQANIILGTVAGDRGTTAAIPLYYQPAENTPIRSLHLEVDFISNSVKFSRAEKGIAAEIQDYDLTVEAEPLPDDDQGLSRTRLIIDVAVADGDPGKALPQGLWSFLEFRIPPEAKPFAISLTPASVSAQGASQQPVPVAAEAGKVIVSVPDEPLVGCFFFTH